MFDEWYAAYEAKAFSDIESFIDFLLQQIHLMWVECRNDVYIFVNR